MTLGCPQRPALHLPGQLRRGPGVEARERSLFLRPAAWVTSPFVPLSHSEKPLPRCHVISSVAMRNSVFSRKRCSLAREGRELGAAPLLPAPRPLQGRGAHSMMGHPPGTRVAPAPLLWRRPTPMVGWAPAGRGRPGTHPGRLQACGIQGQLLVYFYTCGLFMWAENAVRTQWNVRLCSAGVKQLLNLLCSERG